MITKTILLINDEPSLRELVQACLYHLGGWQVLLAASAVEGLHLAAQTQPDAIVLDLAASGKDYFTFLHKLRAQSATQTIPVVVLTAGAKWMDAKRLQQFHVVGAIDYAFDPTQLADQIAQLLNWDEQSAEVED